MPSTSLRQTVLRNARSLVVKLGTQLLTRRDGPGIDTAYLGTMADQITTLRQRGIQVTLVSSGAIGAGCAELGLAKRPADVAEQQAVAAVGQRRLMSHMHDVFEPRGIKVAQLLLTRGDFDDRLRFLNFRNCIGHLHRMGCLPIINENDTVATDELRFGDNDMLAALTASALRAEVLVLLTVVPGILDERNRTLDLIEAAQEARAVARQEKSALGTGGIQSKIESARIVTDAGELAVIADGRDPDVLLRLLDGQKLGTVFAPAVRKLDSRRRWIGLTRRPSGSVTVDDGAARALTAQGKSLLASGIRAVAGRFDAGDVVAVRDAAGTEIARGLSNYSAQDVHCIMGKRSSQFQKLLGRPGFAEVIHRDNLHVHRAASEG